MLTESVEYKRFVWQLNNVLNVNKTMKKFVFLCVGTKNVKGDSFGPTVGTILKNKLIINENIEIWGDLENNVEYGNITNNLDQIKEKYKDTLIIAIDSAVSEECDIGKIFVVNRGLKYAQALEKSNEVVGNISIKAVVAQDEKNGLKNFNNLKNVSEELIIKLSKIVSKGIINVMNKNGHIGKNIYI